MARLAVLTDGLPDDTTWKGAYTWEIIRGLAESQHEVAVFTTVETDRVTITHPRLTVARPAPTFHVDRMARWAQALLNFRPEVIHTFALQPSSRWPSLTIWPYLDALCKVMPGVVRVSTMFERADFAESGTPALAWHLGSQSWTVFSNDTAEAARTQFHGRIEVAPLDDLVPALPSTDDESFDSERGYTFVPAPVSEWIHPRHGLAMLADHLQVRPETRVWINGGWGDLSLAQRRQGWQFLMPVAARVCLLERQSLAGFVERSKAASKIWLEGVPQDSWRHLLSVQVGRQLGKELVGGSLAAVLPVGSTANFLSRMYLNS